MYGKKMLCVLGALMILALPMPVMADEAAPAVVDSAMAQKVADLENMMNQMDAFNKDLASRVDQLQNENNALKGDLAQVKNQPVAQVAQAPSAVPAATGALEIALSSTVVGQAIIGGDSTTKHDANFEYTGDLEFTKAFEDYGMAYMDIVFGEGNGVGDFSLVRPTNNDAGSTSADLEVSKFYYEHYFLDGKVSARVGKIDVTDAIDANKYANSEVDQFLNGTFKYNSSIAAPNNTIGVMGKVEILEMLSMDAGVVDGNSDFNEAEDDTFVFDQLTLKTNINELEGAIRAYIWANNARGDDLKNPNDKTKENLGYGFNFEQAVTDAIGIFGRAGWSDGDVNRIGFATSFGFDFDGSLWGRENDNLGLAFGWNDATTQYEKAGNGNNHTEGVSELYYKFFVNDHLHVSPNLQVIWNPNGSGYEDVAATDDSPVIIGGLRSHITW